MGMRAWERDEGQGREDEGLNEGVKVRARR